MPAWAAHQPLTSPPSSRYTGHRPCLHVHCINVLAATQAAALASSMARREEGALDGEVVVRAGSFQECPAPWPRAQHIGVAPYPHTDIFKDRTAWLPRNTRPAPDTATLPAWPAGTKPATECDRSEPGPGPLGIMVEEYLGEVAMVTGVGRGRVGDLHALCQAARDAGDGTELWVHKYRPTAAHAVLGNGDHAGLIVQWLREWGTRPQSSPSPSPAKRRRGRAQIVIETDEGSDSDFAPRVRVRRGGGDSSDDEYLAARRDQYRGACEGRSIMVVTGPPGCGKSAAVYACAEELGHTVIEIHAGMRRAGRCVTDMLSEATQSRRVGGWATQAVDAEGCIVVDDGSEVTPGETASVILVEDIDVLFADEDRGFWGALTQVAESTKRPIVFTSNQPDPFIPPTLRYFHHAFRNPPHRETAALACVVCKHRVPVKLAAVHDRTRRPCAQQISLCEGRPLPPLDVLAMVEALSGDLRQTIATLQFTCLAAPARVLAHVMGIDPHNGPTNRRELVDTLRQKVSACCNGAIPYYHPRVMDVPRTAQDGRRPLAQVCNTLEALARGGHDIAWNAMYGALVAPAPFGEPATGSPSHAAVSAIAGFLDSMSQADAYIRITSYMGDMPGEWRGVDGVVTDDVGAVDEEEQYMQGAGLHESEVRVHTDAEIRSCLDALAFQAFVQAPSTYPADTMAPDTFCVFARADPRAGAWPAQHLAVEEVVPAAAKIWRRNVAMDYLPALRGMHEAELVRQAQNTKRRCVVGAWLPGTMRVDL